MKRSAARPQDVLVGGQPRLFVDHQGRFHAGERALTFLSPHLSTDKEEVHLKKRNQIPNLLENPNIERKKKLKVL
jgi:hypothetical protein